MSRFSRRDFLKLGSLVSGAFAVSRLGTRPSLPASDPSRPNIIILVFDAMSAKNLSLYGYRRHTTPNLERFAARATVYNQHYSPANFTTPGTASLLTGLHPWTHRALNAWGPIARAQAEHNIFRVLGSAYYRLAYCQNMFPNYFFGQFRGDIDKVLSSGAFSMLNQVVADKLGADFSDSHRVFDDFLFQDHYASASLVFGLAQDLQLYETVAHASSPEYPNGFPHTENYPIFFKLRDVIDGLMSTIGQLPAPSLAYLHIWSPHTPYIPTKEYEGVFQDGWAPKPKPDHLLGDGTANRHLNFRRQNYDEYLANLDAEFGRLIDFLDNEGIFDSSYVIVTSDHGEMFERGVNGHDTPLLYDPVVRIPLLISAPGQKHRQDVSLPTTSIDLLPTLARLSGADVPTWCEGKLLPGLGGVENEESSVFLMEGRTNRAFRPMQPATFALRKGAYKLIYYDGYKEYDGQDSFELYNLENDPEEVNDLYSDALPIARDLRAELIARVNAENARFEKST